MTLEDEFTEAADYVQSNATAGAANSVKIDDKKLLELYGLYKVATIGPCNESQPGFFNIKGRAKWSAWKQVSELSFDDAKQKYIEMVKLLFNWTPSSFLNDSDDDESNDEEPKKKGKKGASLTGMGNTVSCFALPMEEDYDKAADPVFSWAKDNDLVNLEKWAETTKHINIQDENGLTPLHWAVDRGHKSACKILLINGADPSSKDCDGSTPLEYAETCEYREIIALINEYLNMQ